MGYAVYHMEKGKGGSGGIGRHIDRIEKEYYNTFGHADVSKRGLNEVFEINTHCKKSLPQAINDRIQEGYKLDKAIRKDAVKFQTHILTGSHEEMKQIFSNPETKQGWIDANREWMEKVYGKNNIVRFVLHLDEKTPHIHAVTVPLTKDGNLSAKSYTNGRQALRDLQTDYANHMSKFDLYRGLQRIGIRHETAAEYYARNTQFDKHKAKMREKICEKGKIISFITENEDKYLDFGISKGLLSEKLVHGTIIDVDGDTLYVKTAFQMLSIDVKKTNIFKSTSDELNEFKALYESLRQEYKAQTQNKSAKPQQITDKKDFGLRM